MDLALWEARTQAVEELLHLDEGLASVGELFGADLEVARATFPRPGEPAEAAELRALYRNYHREARRQHARALEGPSERGPDGVTKVVISSVVMTSTLEFREDEPWAVRVTDQVLGGEPTVLERDGSRVRIRQPGRDWKLSRLVEHVAGVVGAVQVHQVGVGDVARDGA